MVDEKAFHLLRVLKDVNKDDLITKLNQIKENNDTHTSHLYLEEYFRNKDASVPPEIYRYEAQCIVDIFPQYSVEYIESMLETLGSENNRVIVILRQLLKNEPINNLVIPNEHAYTRNQILSDYTRDHNSFDLFSQPTVSSDYFSECYSKLQNTPVSKQETVVSLKRKSDSKIASKSPKIKVIPMASVCNNILRNANNFMIPAARTGFTDTNDISTVQNEQIGFKPEMYPDTNAYPEWELLIPKPPPNIGNVNAKPPSYIPNVDNICSDRNQSHMNSDKTFSEVERLFRENICEEPIQEVKATPSLNSIPHEERLEMKPDSHVTSTDNYPKNNENYWDLTSDNYWNLAAYDLDNELKEIHREMEKSVPLRKVIDDGNLKISSSEEEEEEDYYKSCEEELNSIQKTIEEVINDDSSKPTQSYDNKLVFKIMEMFPDASPVYIKQLCIAKTVSPADMDAVVQTILSNPDYPKRKQREPSPDPELDLEEQVSLLKEILPDADPNYLQYHAELYLHDKEKLKEFISNTFELKNYPTMKDYLRKQQLSAQVRQYTTEFNIEKFLEIIPDPETYFNDPNKKSSLLENNSVDVFSLHYATRFLRNHYPMIAVKTINYIMAKHKDHLTATVKELDGLVASGKGLMKSKRKPVNIDSTIQNIPLLQEIAYLNHQTKIKQYLEERETREKEEKELSKKNGLIRTCNCCFNDEVMPKNIVKCENGCDFCNECVKTSVEILFGEGKLDFPCLQTCDGFFSLQTLKDVLSPKMFSKMAQKKQLEEVKAAGIEELEMCPFCDFATIPAPGDKLFRCLNSECMKESCRQCKEPSHVPLRCDEIEKDDDVQKRVYIENKMTEALVRVCYKCGMKFIKADGCNKMTCSCGAMMCYVCGEPVKDYTHFNGQGGDKYHLCPLFSDTNKLHKEAVIKSAEQAKVEVGVADDPRKLKIDPSADLHQHYKMKKSKTELNYGEMDPMFMQVQEARFRLQEMDRELRVVLQRPDALPQDRFHYYHHHHHHHRPHRSHYHNE